MSDFLTSYIADFYASVGAPAQPVDAVAVDDSSERALLQTAIGGGDPAVIDEAARAVITADMTQLAQEVLALREKVWHLRLMLAAISSISATTPVPSEIVNAIRAEKEVEVPYEAFPQAAAILQTYRTALQTDSAAVLS